MEAVPNLRTREPDPRKAPQTYNQPHIKTLLPTEKGLGQETYRTGHYPSMPSQSWGLRKTS